MGEKVVLMCTGKGKKENLNENAVLSNVLSSILLSLTDQWFMAPLSRNSKKLILIPILVRYTERLANSFVQRGTFGSQKHLLQPCTLIFALHSKTSYTQEMVKIV